MNPKIKTTAARRVATIQYATDKLTSIHALRGIASLWVCWFHLTRGSSAFPTWEPLRATGINGWLGVDIFFVISGFIIPYVLYRARYSLNQFGIFVLKRLIRLEPPYLVSIVAILALNFASTLSPLFRGPPFHIDFTQLALHVGYLIPFSGLKWLNDVYWTLAIEFQYYLLLGLLFPFLLKRKRVDTLVVLLLALAAFLVETDKLIFHWFFLFFLGFVTFQFHVRLSGKLMSSVLAALAVWGCAHTLGWHAAAAGLFAAGFILLWRHSHPILLFLGNISFSLYLIHVPMGGRVVNLGSRFFTSELGQVFVVITALLVSLLSAWILYRLVEKPAQQWAARIRYA